MAIPIRYFHYTRTRPLYYVIRHTSYVVRPTEQGYTGTRPFPRAWVQPQPTKAGDTKHAKKRTRRCPPGGDQRVVAVSAERERSRISVTRVEQTPAPPCWSSGCTRASGSRWTWLWAPRWVCICMGGRVPWFYGISVKLIFFFKFKNAKAKKHQERLKVRSFCWMS